MEETAILLLGVLPWLWTVSPCNEHLSTFLANEGIVESAFHQSACSTDDVSCFQTTGTVAEKLGFSLDNEIAHTLVFLAATTLWTQVCSGLCHSM